MSSLTVLLKYLAQKLGKFIMYSLLTICHRPFHFQLYTIIFHFRSPVSKEIAEKMRDYLAKELYDELFRKIMTHINDRSSSATSVYSIGILDITGFGMCGVFYS